MTAQCYDVSGGRATYLPLWGTRFDRLGRTRESKLRERPTVGGRLNRSRDILLRSLLAGSYLAIGVLPGSLAIAQPAAPPEIKLATGSGVTVLPQPKAAPSGLATRRVTFLRGFGDAQANLALQRTFPIYERVKLDFRAEAFNISNHPNFGAISTTCGVTTAGASCNSPIMGQATNTLLAALGGLSSLYQQGGPRSLQFMLKLEF